MWRFTIFKSAIVQKNHWWISASLWKEQYLGLCRSSRKEKDLAWKNGLQAQIQFKCQNKLIQSLLGCQIVSVTKNYQFGGNFSTLVKSFTKQISLTLAAFYSWRTKHINSVTAYLNTEIDLLL